MPPRPRTAWSASSSVPSDRIKVHPSPSLQIVRTNSASSISKGKGVDRSGVQKSEEVVELESYLEKLRGIDGGKGWKKDKKGGCFCLARTHQLSPHVPICHSCGLILCILNAPYHACPFCGDPLLTDAARARLINELELKIEEVIRKENEERERIELEAKKKVGEFPVLGMNAPVVGNVNNQSRPTPAATQAHKVLSLSSQPNSRNKKVIVTSYKPAPPPPIPQATSKDAIKQSTPELKRVPPPPDEVPYVKVEPGKEIRRPYANQSGNGPIYVPPELRRGRIDAPDEAVAEGSGSKKAKKKGKGKAGEKAHS